MNTKFVLLAWLASTAAFQSQIPSSLTFIGRGTSVCNPTEHACPPTRTVYIHHSPAHSQGMAMKLPRFLKRLGLRRGDKSEETSSVAVLEPIMEVASDAVATLNATTAVIGTDECVVAEEETLSETDKLMKQVKDAGLAGVISYALWELGFWTVSVPVCVFGYREVTGHWPDFQNQEDLQKLGAEAFAFVNFARFAVPLRIGLALSTTPWIQENVVDRFLKKDEPVCDPEPSEE